MGRQSSFDLLASLRLQPSENRRTSRVKAIARRFTRKLRIIMMRALREHSSPTRTALGFGFGSFIGVFPSFLLGSPLAYFLAGLLRLNRAAAVGGTFMTNPVTAPIFYSVSAWLGGRIIGPVSEEAKVEGMVAALRHFGLSFLVGNTIFALAFAAVATTALFLFLYATKRGTPLRDGTPPAGTK